MNSISSFLRAAGVKTLEGATVSRSKGLVGKGSARIVCDMPIEALDDSAKLNSAIRKSAENDLIVVAFRKPNDVGAMISDVKALDADVTAEFFSGVPAEKSNRKSKRNKSNPVPADPVVNGQAT